MKGLFLFNILPFLIFFLILGIPIKAKGLMAERTLFYEHDFYQQKWTGMASSKEENFKGLARILEKSVTGRKLWQKASEKALEEGDSLLNILVVGKSSFTDTALIRRFDPTHPDRMEIRFRTQISLSSDLGLLDAVLDLAHELTHFIYRKPFNPYSQEFSLENFIKTTVEGEGGEVAAYLSECQVLNELFPHKIFKNYHCHKILDPEKRTFSRHEGLKQFYKVGVHYGDFNTLLTHQGIRESFPLLDQEESVFISSAYGLPYPLAALEEFKTVVKKACANEYSRLKMVKENFLELPSSHPTFQEQLPLVKAMERNFVERCQSDKVNL